MAVNRHDDHDEVRRPNWNSPKALEHRDVNVWAVGRFGIALAFLCVLPGPSLRLVRISNRIVGGTLPKSINVDARRLPPKPHLQRAPIRI